MPRRSAEENAPKSAKPSVMSEDAVLLLKILQLIPQRRWTTIAEIAEQLEAQGTPLKRRSLQRYLQTIRSHPEIFPISVDVTEKPYRFRWDLRSKGLHLPVLSVQDTLLLRLAEEHLRYQLPPSVLSGLRPLFHDAKQMAALNAKRREYSWLRKVKVVSPSLPFMAPKINAQVFEHASEALFADKMLFVRYRNARGKLVEAYVMPLALVQQDVRTYLVCQFEGYSNFRHLALHRIESARVTTFDFERPADFDLEDYTARAPFNYAQGRTIRLEILTDDPVLVKNLEETPFNRTQAVVSEAPAPDPRWRITVDIEDSLLLDGWLAMRRASILSTKKTLIKTNDAAQKPAPKLRRASATQAAAEEPAEASEAPFSTGAEKAAPDEAPGAPEASEAPEGGEAPSAASAAFAPQRFASRIATPEEHRARLAENDPQREREKPRPHESLLVVGRHIVEAASEESD